MQHPTDDAKTNQELKSINSLIVRDIRESELVSFVTVLDSIIDPAATEPIFSVLFENMADIHGWLSDGSFSDF